ncbi:MAG: hypothetical protein R6T83_08380 [Salinibacter sp.]
MMPRAKRAWKDAWLSFRSLIWTQFEDPGWYWMDQALELYRQDEDAVLTALRSEMEDLAWWNEWHRWNERYERLLPTATDLRRADPSRSLPSDLPLPPEEPDGIWSRTRALWTSNRQHRAIGAGAIQTVLARGRATRLIRGA